MRIPLFFFFLGSGLAKTPETRTRSPAASIRGTRAGVQREGCHERGSQRVPEKINHLEAGQQAFRDVHIYAFAFFVSEKSGVSY